MIFKKEYGTKLKKLNLVTQKPILKLLKKSAFLQDLSEESVVKTNF